MEAEILEQEEAQIFESLEDLDFKIDCLKDKLLKINKASNFTDSLNDSFYMGRVGFMGKKANAKKERELNKFIDSCNSERKINAEISTLEKRISKLKTGYYLIRKNNLLVDSYKCLTEKREAFETILKSNLLKGKPLTEENKSIVKDLKRENLAKIRKTEKQYKTTLLTA
jgi:polyhydroxyalkanoate synthesis regulator phasin